MQTPLAFLFYFLITTNINKVHFNLSHKLLEYETELCQNPLRQLLGLKNGNLAGPWLKVWHYSTTRCCGECQMMFLLPTES